MQRLITAGRWISAIGHELGFARKTVRRSAFADSIDELPTAAITRSSLLDAFKRYRHQQLNAATH